MSDGSPTPRSASVAMTWIICVTIIVVAGIGALAFCSGLRTYREVKTASTNNRTLVVRGMALRRNLPSTSARWVAIPRALAKSKEETVSLLHERVEAIRTLLRAQGIPDAAVTMEPENISEGYNEQGPNGYDASRFIRVETTEVATLEKLNAAAMDLVTNKTLDYMPMVEFVLDDTQALRTELVAEAATSARKTAESMAKAGRGRLGRLVGVHILASGTMAQGMQYWPSPLPTDVNGQPLPPYDESVQNDTSAKMKDAFAEVRLTYALD